MSATGEAGGQRGRADAPRRPVDVLADVCVRVLGPVHGQHLGSAISFGGERQRRLFAVLVLHLNSTVPLSMMVQLMWESPPATARQQVHNSVASLRRAIGRFGGRLQIETTDVGYRLKAFPADIDLFRFRDTLAEAEKAMAARDFPAAMAGFESTIGMWSGDAAFAEVGGDEIQRAAQILNEQRADALECVAVLRLAAGDDSNLLIENLSAWVATFPTRETFRLVQMLALHRNGRQVAALDVYERGKRILVTEFGLDPSPRAQSLQSRILRDAEGGDGLIAEFVQDYLQRNSRHPPQADLGVARPLCFLPHEVGEFVGRDDEIAKLVKDAGSEHGSPLVISAVDGMGGIGKTTLAVRVARMLIPRFADGQFFVDLHGFTSDVAPISASEALEQLLGQAGVRPELIPPGTAARAALWRSHLAGSRMLVVLDNVLEAAQVRPLIPSSHESVVLITSRRKLQGLEGARPLTLEVLSEAEAISLFTRVTGDERIGQHRDLLPRVLELCGWLPLAIRIAAARFRDRTTWTLEHLVVQLESESSRLPFLASGDRDVMTAISVSYKHLAPDCQHVFRVLGINPGQHYDRGSVAALCNLRPDEADRILSLLYDDNLLFEDSPGRYRIHDLVRDCARSILRSVESEQTRREAISRLLDYYLAASGEWIAMAGAGPVPLVPRSASAVPVRPAATAEEARGLLDLELGNIIAAARMAISESLHGYAWRLVAALHPMLLMNGCTDETMQLLDEALASARLDGDPRGISNLLAAKSSASRKRGSNQDAMATLILALAITRELGDRSVEARQLLELGIVAHEMSDFAAATEHFNAAKLLAAELGDEHALVFATNNLGVVARDVGDWSRARAYFEEALTLSERAGDPESPLLMRLNLANVAQATGRFDEAATRLDALIRDTDDGDLAALKTGALTARANVYRLFGEFDSAIEFGRSALILARKCGLQYLELSALATVGDIYVSQGQFDSAENVFNSVAELADRGEFARYQGRAQEGLAHISIGLTDLEGATKRWRNALSHYPVGLAERRHAIAHLDAVPGDAPKCGRCYVVAGTAG